MVGASTSLTFTIANIGTADLNLTGSPKVAVTGDADFVVTTQPSLATVTSSGPTTTFVVTFTPTTTVGTRTATIHIASNDPDENPFNITLTGTGTTAYDQWALSKGLTGLPGSNTDPAFDADPDKDGVKNGLEWVLGGNPTQNDAPSKLPVVTVAGGSLNQTFTREETSISETALVIQYGTNLVNWPKSVTVGATSAGPDVNGAAVTINTAATPDGVTVTIPGSNAVGGKLFARMQVTRLAVP